MVTVALGIWESHHAAFNVAKTNAICESVYSPWTGGSKKQIQFSDLKNDHLWKTNTNALSWESVISSASQSLQIHNITGLQRNAVPVSRTPPESESHARARVTRLPQKASTFENDATFTGLSAAVKDALMSTTSSKSCWEGNQQLLKGCKTFPWILKTCRGNMPFLLSLRLTEKIVADSPSRLRLCVLIGCWKIALLRLPKFQLWDTKPVTWRQWTPATSSDCRPETSCCASFPCSLWTIEIKHYIEERPCCNKSGTKCEFSTA